MSATVPGTEPRWPVSRQGIAIGIVGSGAARVVARATGAGWLPALALAVVLGLGLVLWGSDEEKSWGDVGQGIVVSVIVALALLAVQRDAADRLRLATQHRDDQLRAAERRRQVAADRSSLQLTLSSQPDLTEVSLAGRDLRGFFLAGKKLFRANLRKARLDRANLRVADLREVEADGARFDGAVLARADLRYGWFEPLNVSLKPGPPSAPSASFRRAFLPGADLRGASASNVDFTAADLSDTKLREADLTYTDLRRAFLASADVRGAFLGRSDLRRAKLGHATLCHAHLAGAQLRGAEYDSATRWPPGFRPRQRGAIKTSSANDIERNGAMYGAITVHPPCDR